MKFGIIDKQFVYECQNIILDSAGLKIEKNSIEKLHEYISKNEINDIRIDAFKAINKLNWEKAILDNCYKDLVSMLGPDLLIQKKINLSIQMPNDESSILEAHSDCSSGDSPFELVLWIPLTKCYDSNSMFILSQKESSEIYEKIKSNEKYEVNPNKSKFVTADPGKFGIFAPTLIHGNILNRTEITRSSLNVRVKSVFSPYTQEVVQDRTYGTYYKKLSITSLTEWNIKIYNTLK